MVSKRLKIKGKHLNNNGEHVNVKALFTQSIVGTIKSTTNGPLVTDEKSLQDKIDTLNNEMNNVLMRLKLKQSQFVFKAKGWRTYRKRKLHIKHTVCKKLRTVMNVQPRRKKRKCLRTIKFIKQVRITTNTFHN